MARQGNPLKAGYGPATVKANIAQMMREGYPQARAVAAALRNARESFFKRHPKGFPPWHLRTPEEKARTGSASRARNPVPRSSVQRQVEQASLLYHKFSGHQAEEVGTIDKPVLPDVMIAIGTVDGILYTTVRDGVTEKYIHKFAAKARPLFAVSPDGQQLFMIGGSYNFTERGIVDET